MAWLQTGRGTRTMVPHPERYGALGERPVLEETYHPQMVEPRLDRSRREVRLACTLGGASQSGLCCSEDLWLPGFTICVGSAFKGTLFDKWTCTQACGMHNPCMHRACRHSCDSVLARSRFDLQAMLKEPLKLAACCYDTGRPRSARGRACPHKDQQKRANSAYLKVSALGAHCNAWMKGNQSNVMK